MKLLKHVIVIASGETERRALPHLLSHLRGEGIFIEAVRIPPRNRQLNLRTVESLVKSAWHEFSVRTVDKFVVLVDADGKPSEEVLQPLMNLSQRLGRDITANVQYAFAQWHLEAWFFADATSLRQHLGRSLGQVDTSKPDEIQNPKLHLKNLLGRQVYTARTAEEIASEMNPHTIAQRSPSFGMFLEAIQNGPRHIDSKPA